MQFRGRLVRQYRACVVDSLGLGITCLISLYYVYKVSQSCLLCHPYIPHSNLFFTFVDLITIPNLKSADHIGAGIQQCYEQPRHKYSLDYSCTVHVRRHVHGLHSYIGKTLYIVLSSKNKNSHGKCVASP